MNLDELYAPYDTEGRYTSFPQITIWRVYVLNIVDAICEEVNSFNRAVTDAKIVAEINNSGYPYTDDEKIAVFREVKEELNFVLYTEDDKLPRLTKKEKERIKNLFGEWEKENPNHKKSVKKLVKKTTEVPVKDETLPVVEVEQPVDSYNREDYTDVIAEATNTIIRYWLYDGGDTSWLTICETLWDIKPDCQTNEETAIVNWIEEDVHEAMNKARKAIND